MQNNVIENLIYLFSKLPGLGKRSATRITLHLLQEKDTRLKSLLDILNIALNEIQKCNICGNLSDKDICNICIDNDRDSKLIAIVENIADLWAIERSGIFKGRYYVLENRSSSSASSFSDINMEKFIDIYKKNKIEEVIIATNATIEGQTKAFLITEILKEYPIKLSRLASGIPLGGELEYLDEGTLSLAINMRQPFGE